MSRIRHGVLAAVVALGALADAASASAYCRTKACDTDPSYGDVWDEEPQPTECIRNAQGCYTQGTPLFWPSNCLSFAVQRDGSESSDIDYSTADSIVALAFEKWRGVDCGGGARPSFTYVNRGPIECRKAEYNQTTANANAFMFRDRNWPYRNAIDTLALTTITYNVETAAIYDADVEINSAEERFTTTETPPPDAADLEAVVTHEVGHFLGLSHSEVPAATMRGIGYQLGTTGLRTLAEDDVRGICEIYPPGERLSEKCTPRHGFSSECGRVDEGCAVVTRGQSPNAAAFGALSLFGLGLLLRRVRRGSAPPRKGSA